MAQTKQPVRALDKYADAFVATRLPQWLKQASPGQINKLRDCYTAHRNSHEPLDKALRSLPTPQAYALKVFTPLLSNSAATLGFDKMQWLDVRRRLDVPVGIGVPTDELRYVRTPALLTLMQNFPDGDPFYEGSGLVVEGESLVLIDGNGLAKQCRKADAGQGYQKLLASTVTDSVRGKLAAHKRTGFALALELAALKGQLDGASHAALRAVGTTGHGDKLLRGYAGQLKVLNCLIADALLIQLHEADGKNKGMVLYLPSDVQQPLRYFADIAAVCDALVKDLSEKAFQQNLCNQVKLRERADFIETLNQRLKDSQPDLQLERATLTGDVFAALAKAHFEHLEDDARMLLVSTADADKTAASERLKRWEGIAMGAAGIAGLFVPGLGELLLAQLLVQVTEQLYDGVTDWAQGHQHEATEHLLGVAEIAAVTAVTAVGAGLVARGFARGAVIDELEPVTVKQDDDRLWKHDLSVYEVSPGLATLQDDGFYHEGDLRFLRIESRYYEVHQPDEDGPWRLLHPARDDAFEPELVGNGERCWRLRLERPLEWDDSTLMLERLWPSHPPREATEVARILQVAGVDKDELRGLLVENRQLPVNLRDTVRRFDADARINRLFSALGQAPETIPEKDMLTWCKAQAALQGLSDTQIGSTLLQDQGRWGHALFEHLTAPGEVDDAVLALLKRDFPGLPDAYAREALSRLNVDERLAMAASQRLSLSLAQKARALLQLARVNRAFEGVFLQNAYTDGSGELVIALLRKLPEWPGDLNLELRKGNESGPLLAQLNPQGKAESRTVMVYRQGGFRLYDHRGVERAEEIAEPASLFDALVALLKPEQRTRLGLSQDSAAQQLRERLAKQLPGQRSQVFNLLGWRNQSPWFNPGARLADGRVGYTLGGRTPGSEVSVRTLRERIRALYPGFTEVQVESFFQRLLREPGSPLDQLLEHEDNFRQLDRALTRWERATTNENLRNQQRQFAEQLRRAWRLDGGVEIDLADNTDTVRLSLSGWQIERLPTLPAEVDMSHIGELVLAGMGLQDVPANFLRCFRHVHTLVLTNNRLTSIPPGLSHLQALRTLRLMSNRIRMSSQDQDMLRSMPYLHMVDLSHNPLRSLSLRFNELPQLRRLRLDNCHLQVMPEGLERCEFLEFADLSDNQIQTLPPELVRMPWRFRARLNLSRNPLSAAERQRFYGLSHQRHGTALNVPVDADAHLNQWLGDQPEAHQPARRALWQRLQEMDGSTELFELLQALTQGSDFTHARAYLSDQVWGLLAALDQDQTLRSEIFESAREPIGCVDSSAERFSRLQIQVLAHEANLRSAQADAGSQLLTLGRQLFRLEALDRFAFQAVEQRRRVQGVVDDLEIVLGYRIHLAKALNLPCQPQSMRFSSLADITEERGREALAAVQAEETPEALAHSIARQGFWTAYLRQQHPEPFAATARAFDARGEALDEQASTLTSEVYTQRWDELKYEREAAEQALELMLTRDALERTTGER
ncbi:NEL-type E3 ubiquitin ligase domain-containing protein [Pseudomonas sp. NPDC089396]|uniref:NEL-type E3 ubiquitin ligase domain-containing protein n=1 Tax=Pseudomonas sp. NPDC089396 TaxID=3364461 RepID=UPI0038333B01